MYTKVGQSRMHDLMTSLHASAPLSICSVGHMVDTNMETATLMVRPYSLCDTGTSCNAKSLWRESRKFSSLKKCKFCSFSSKGEMGGASTFGLSFSQLLRNVDSLFILLCLVWFPV